MAKKSCYHDFADFYDCMDTHANITYNLIKKKIKKFHPNAKSILEMACGTGKVINKLSRHYDCWGFDASRQMIEKAKEKKKRVNFFIADMRTFNIKHKFDVIFCIFDSINHLLNLNEWKKTFINSYKHLSKGGLFIFDVNTPSQLNNFYNYPVQLLKKNNEYCIIEIKSLGKNSAEWDITMFKKIKRKKYYISKEKICEKAFALSEIKIRLKSHFNILEIVNSKNQPVKKDEKRIFFICKKK